MDGQKIKGEYYYVQNDEVLRNTVAYIGNSYYGFGWDGKMHADGMFDIYDDNIGNWICYRAKANGALYVNEWYEEYGASYYYGNGGRAATGWNTISGKTFYFYDDGHIAKNTVNKIDSINYVFDETGYAYQLKEKWTKVKDNWYYVDNGEVIRNAVVQIGTAYYGFDWDGHMYTGRFSIYDSQTGKTSYYRVKNTSGALYVNEWVQDGTIWYYYGVGGKAVAGPIEIGGKKYYFSPYGELMKNTIQEYGGKVYKVDKNGAYTLVADGWIKHPASGNWMYVENGQLIHNGVKSIGGALYAFSNSYMVEQGLYRDGIEGKYYLINAGGKINLTSGWKKQSGAWYYGNTDGSLYEGILLNSGKKYYLNPSMVYAQEIIVYDDKAYMVDRSGVLTEIKKDGFYENRYTDYTSSVYYVSDGKLLKDQWKKIDGSWYYFRPDGTRVSNAEYYQIGDKYYSFDSDGKMFSNTWIYGNNYYASASGALLIGEQKIDGKWYFFNQYGQKQRGIVYYNGKKYLYGQDGVYIGTISKEGWNTINGVDYFVSNGEVYVDRTYQDSKGNIYAFDAQGRKIVNALYGYGSQRYFLGNDGIAKTGWIKDKNRYYYGDLKTSKLFTGGEYTISGKQYYFDYYGVMYTGDLLRDGKVYKYGDNGALKGIESFKDGWNYVSGSAVYYRDGKPYTGWTDGRYVRNGIMLREQAWYDSSTGASYFLGKDGKYLRNQWVDGAYYGYINVYAKADGKLACDEWLEIDGAKYYFSDVYKVTGCRKIDNKWYLFDVNGKLIQEISENQKDGWVKLNGEYYYYHAGVPVTGRYIKDGDAWYYLDYDGRMVKNVIIAGGYFDGSGKKANYVGWKKINNKWYYFDKDSRNVTHGWVNDGGKSYYISDGMVTGYYMVGGRLYLFGTNGALQEEVKVQNGWYKAGNDWYYFQNGSLVGTGIYIINGKNYLFESGKMVTNGISHYEGSSYYAGSDGVVVTASGWKETAKGWIYIQDGGRLAVGAQKIGDKIYYFDQYHYLSN